MHRLGSTLGKYIEVPQCFSLTTLLLLSLDTKCVVVYRKYSRITEEINKDKNRIIHPGLSHASHKSCVLQVSYYVLAFQFKHLWDIL